MYSRRFVKARNDHDKTRSERATLADRLEADRTLHTTEIDKLKAEALECEATAKEAELEKTLLTQTVERLQAELAASKSSNEQFAAQLAHSKEKEDDSHTKELKHVAEVAKQQARARVLDAAVDSSKTRIDALSAEVAQVRAEFANVKKSNELLVEEKSSIDRICQLEREQAAVARGEIIALEKRVSAQVSTWVASCLLSAEQRLTPSTTTGRAHPQPHPRQGNSATSPRSSQPPRRLSQEASRRALNRAPSDRAAHLHHLHHRGPSQRQRNQQDRGAHRNGGLPREVRCARGGFGEDEGGGEERVGGYGGEADGPRRGEG